MSKHNHFVIFLKKINLSINSLLQKYLNKLNFNNLSNIRYSNKVFLTLVGLIILFLLYLSIPHIYDKAKIRKTLENQLLDKFKLNFIFSKNLDYNFLPRPHFLIEESSIVENQTKVADIKKLRIYVSLDSLFSLENIIINDVILENTNFNLNKQNSNFFMKLLDNIFSEGIFNIKNSNVFYRNTEEEVLFMNKIINMKYYYDPKELKNFVKSENKIFNIPYSFGSQIDKKKKKIFTKVNLNFLRLQIENELDYNNDQKKGLTDIIFNKNKSEAFYKWNENYFNFNFLDKSSDPKFIYKGNINFRPFYSVFKGNIDKINLYNFFKSNSLFVQLFKTEILNNKNLTIDINIDAKKIAQLQNFINIILNFKIQEGLIDIDYTKFSWNDYVDFEIVDSLFYVNKNQLILDGKFLMNIRDYEEIYKFLQVSKNLRPELKKLEINFNYNFDQQVIDFNNITIDGQSSQKVNNVMKKIILKKNKLQNKIYFKNVIKAVLAAYVG